jgi:hypothetical protein
MKTGIFLFIFYFCALSPGRAQFLLVQPNKPITVVINDREEAVVHTALDIFFHDMEKVSGKKPLLTGATTENLPTLIIGTIGKNLQLSQLINEQLLSVDTIKGQWEAFLIQAVKHKGVSRLVVAGSDSRGTAYGILELSRMIGVSPWEWWADVVPDKKTEVIVPENYRLIQQPSVQYRGIFLNDEDWGLLPWSNQTFEPSNQKERIGPVTYAKIFELLLRLRANTLWPAMHESTIPFYFVEGNKETADKYGIVIGTSHCEPLMRNNAGEWNAQTMGDYNYLTNKTRIQNYWEERLKTVGQSENFYTLGMRGVHDGQMEGVKTLNEHTAALSQVLKDQRALLKNLVNKDVSQIPQAFIPYKEVLEVYDNGLDLPEDITLVWCDDNYGYLTRLSNAEEQKRSGGGGIYYHISYWGRPHDYLWLCTTQPALMFWQLQNAWNHHARKLWILNVGDIKPAEYNIEFFMDMAWDIHAFAPDNAADHMKQLYARDFGQALSTGIAGVMDEYYRLASIRKPEFMAWSRVEEPSVKGGKTPAIDTEFNPDAFGDEISNRLEAYNTLRMQVEALKKQLPDEKKDAFFQLVEYPVCAAAGMNEKWLYAQKARLYAAQDLPVANEYAERSRKAFNDLVELTKKYNEEIAHGKWKGIMDMKPRNLPVFQEASYPAFVEAPHLDSKPNRILNPVGFMNEMIALNAKNYTRFGAVKPVEIKGLGHSNAALELPVGEINAIEYDIDTFTSGDILLRTCLIPNHPVDEDIRYAVAVDGEEPQIVSIKTQFRSEAWKINVLRNQSVNCTNHHLKQAGKHTIRIYALDRGIILDQLMVDFDLQRKFYEIPVNRQ